MTSMRDPSSSRLPRVHRSRLRRLLSKAVVVFAGDFHCPCFFITSDQTEDELGNRPAGARDVGLCQRVVSRRPSRDWPRSGPRSDLPPSQSQRARRASAHRQATPRRQKATRRGITDRGGFQRWRRVSTNLHLYCHCKSAKVEGGVCRSASTQRATQTTPPESRMAMAALRRG